MASSGDSSGDKLSERARTNVDVINRSGATGSIGTEPTMPMPLKEKLPFRHGPKTDWSKHPIWYLIAVVAIVLVFWLSF